MIHAKQLCLLCLLHPLSVGCEVAGKGVGCPMGDCDRLHHAALHGVLKAGGPSLPEDDGNGVAHSGARVEHARVTSVG